MPRDPLATMLRLRRLALDDARRALAASVRAEDEAHRQAREADAIVGREAQVAADISLGDGAVEAFAAWLPVGLARAEALHASHADRSQQVALHRAALAASQSAAEAASALLDRRAAALAERDGRRDQAVLDEAASRAKPPGSG